MDPQHWFEGRKRWLVLPPGEEKKVEVGPATVVYDLLSQESTRLQVPVPTYASLSLLSNLQLWWDSIMDTIQFVASGRYEYLGRKYCNWIRGSQVKFWVTCCIFVSTKIAIYFFHIFSLASVRIRISFLTSKRMRIQGANYYESRSGSWLHFAVTTKSWILREKYT